MKKAVFGVLAGSLVMCSMMAMVPRAGKIKSNDKTHQVFNDTTPGMGKHKKTDTSSYPKDTTRVTQDLK